MTLEEQQIQTPPDPPQDPPTKKLYNNLLKDGYTVENLGSEDDFTKMLSDSTKAKKLYGNLLKDGYTPENLGSEDDFLKTVMPPAPVKPANNIDLALQSAELKKKGQWLGSGGTGGGGGSWSPDAEAQKQAAAIDADIKSKGDNPDELAETFADFPKELLKVPGYTTDELVKLKQDNPQLFSRRISTAKWQVGLSKAVQSAIDEGDIDTEKGKKIIEGIGAAQGGENYQTKRQSTQILSQWIDDYVKDDKEKEKLKSYLANDKIFSYGQPDEKELAADTRSQYLDKNQLIGLHWLEDTQKDKAAQYYSLLFDKNKINDNARAQMGYEERAQKLETLGLQLQQTAVEEELNNIASHSDGSTIPQQYQQRFNELLARRDQLDNEAKQIATKYKYPLQNETESFVRELIGNEVNGNEKPLSYAGMRVGEAAENTTSGIWDMLSQPFSSDESNKINQLEALGVLSQSEAFMGKRQKDALLQTFVPKVSDKLQAMIKPIIDNKDLSWEEKYKQLFPILKDNPTEWGKVPIKGGKLNIGPSTLYHSVVDLGASLVPFMALETITGGGATAGALRKLTSTFVAAAATSFESEYQSALKNGDANPYQRALLNTAISSAAMAGAGTPDMVRKMLSTKTAIGDLVSKLTDDEILAAMNSKPAALKQFFTSIGKGAAQGLKEGGKFEAFMGGAELVKSKMNNEPIDPEMFFKERIVGALSFAAFGGVRGGATASKNPLQVDALYRAAETPDAFLETAKAMKDEGRISADQFMQIQANIEKAAKVVSSTQFINNNGKPLPPEKRNELLLLKMQEADIKESVKGDVPEKFAEKQNEKLEELKQEQAKIYATTNKEIEQPTVSEVPQPEKETVENTVKERQVGDAESSNAVLEDKKADIERRRQEELNNVGVKQKERAFSQLRDEKDEDGKVTKVRTPEEKLNAVNLIERNVAEGSILTKEEQEELQKTKDELASQGYEVPKILGQKYHEGMRVIVTNSIPDETLAEGEEVITKVLNPQINKDGKMVQTAQIEVTVGTKKGGLTREQWLEEQKKKETRTDKINAKYDAELAELEKSQPTPQTGKGEGDWSRDVESTAKALEKGNGNAEYSKEGALNVAKNYHKAKKDGTNPELVKAVEDLLGKPKETTPTPQTGKGESIEDKKADIERRRQEEFKNAGELSKKEGKADAIANYLLQNAKVGDTITDKNGDGYEATEVKTRKDGTREVVLVPFELVDGKKDYNYSGTKLISENNKKAASDLYEFSYTNSNGERVTETYNYNAKYDDAELAALENEKQNTQSNIPEVPQPSKETLSRAQQAADMYYEIREAEGGSKKRRLSAKRREFMMNNERMQYIDNNIQDIYSQLEKKKLITKKGDCP